tara:strand:- start:233139 stop:235133 length:1995 start_codon:yes stop_codon:yes gene_type:complete
MRRIVDVYQPEKTLRNHTIALLATVCTLVYSPLIVRGDDATYRAAMAEAVRAAAGEVLPSVVTIEIIGVSGGAEGEVELDAPTSGVVVDSEGFIIASSLVAARTAASILVVLPDGTRHAAEVVSQDHHRDLALLKIETSQPLQTMKFSDDLDLRIGRTVVAVGRYGSKGSPMISTGVLSAVDRLDGIALQTDARVSPTFYGGPLIDLNGNVLGILIPAVAEGGAPDATSWYDSGVAFAIPATIIRQKLDRLKNGKDIKKGLIGIVVKSDDPYDNDTELAAVRTRSPAEKVGLLPGDAIVSVAGDKVRRHQEIKQILGRYDAGEQIAIEYRRDDQVSSVEVTLAETIPPLQPQRLGIAVRPEVDTDGESTAVVVQSVVPNSPADGQIDVGDIILRLGESDINDVQSLRRQMIAAEPDRPIEIKLKRGATDVDISVKPTSIAGEALATMPDDWKAPADETRWIVKELKLPDAANSAAIVLPEVDDETEDPRDSLGMLILLLNADQAAPEDELNDWKEKASEYGVVVCAIASEDSERWQPKEIDVVSRFAAAAIKQAEISSAAVAVAAPGAMSDGKSEASDSMALAVALSAAETFRGVAASEKTRAPAVRLRENDAAQSLQILLPISSPDDAPPWATALKAAGYPIVRGGTVDKDALLRWVRLLQTI